MTYFWAKTQEDQTLGTSVLEHSLNVGSVAFSFCLEFPFIPKLLGMSPNVISALVALHDIGKITPGFQRKSSKWLEENDLLDTDRNYLWKEILEGNHKKTTHQISQDILKSHKFKSKIRKYLATVLGAHHGKIQGIPSDAGVYISKSLDEMISGINWGEHREYFANQVFEYFGCMEEDFRNLNINVELLWVLGGLCTVSDWIGSNAQFFPNSRDSISREDREIFAENALSQIGLRKPVIDENLDFQEIFGFSPNFTQEKALSLITKPGLYIIEDVTGNGKTESAFGASYNLLRSGFATGIYTALPTQATSNRLSIRKSAFVEKICLSTVPTKLTHGNSWLMQSRSSLFENGFDHNYDWFSSVKRALLVPFGVGTVDQALLSVISVLHFFVRRFALVNKIVIIDEVHSYDLYTGTLINHLISTLISSGSTVLVLSATLTKERREELLKLGGNFVSKNDGTSDSYPLISGITCDGESIEEAVPPPKDKSARLEFRDKGSAEEEAASVANKGGAVLWVSNTVAEAQDMYRHFKDKYGGQFLIGLLHARFTFSFREKLENEWMRRLDKSGETRCGCILISTQIVEQSVDIDADLVITDLAPTDLLIQRMGRLWRHQRENRPVSFPRFIILEEENSLEELRTLDATEIRKSLGKKVYVYSPYVLLRTLDVWKNYVTVSAPAQVRELIEKTYTSVFTNPQEWLILKERDESKAEKHRGKALNSSNIWSLQRDDKQQTTTRLSEMPTDSLILCQSFDADSGEIVFLDGSSAILGPGFCLETAKKVHRNLVNVPRYIFDRGEGCGNLLRNYVQNYHSIGVVSPSGKIDVSELKTGYVLLWSDDLGLVKEKVF